MYWLMFLRQAFIEDKSMNRRQFLQLSALAGLPTAYSPSLYAATDPSSTVSSLLNAQHASTNIVGPDFPATDVWAFNGSVPGSPIRLKLGETLKAEVTNSLEVPTAVHWHGIRLPNNMDGVAGLTQGAILPGERFNYSFTPPDAGTFWYHSHLNAPEQVGRGLYGPLIIEEQQPPVVDRELVWMIDDWRLMDDASIRNDFNAGHDSSHAGRIGNVPTVNGRFRDVVQVRSGERLRIRLINASNARNFALNFGELQFSVIAIDGQPVAPFTPDDPIVVGTAGRVDLIVDMMGEPGSDSPVTDHFYRDSFTLVRFAYSTEKPLRAEPMAFPVALDAAKLPEPDLANAITQSIVIAGGAMGGLRRAKLDGQWMPLGDIAQLGYMWAINDTVANRLDMPPLIDVKMGSTVKITLDNQSAFPHPMHLHGHHMKLLSIDGELMESPRWVDSPLLMPRQRMELAFVADNPGQWLFHCHALEHHAAGLGALVLVT